MSGAATVLIVGCGEVGRGLAIHAYAAGFEVEAWDREADVIPLVAGVRLRSIDAAQPLTWPRDVGVPDVVVHTYCGWPSTRDVVRNPRVASDYVAAAMALRSRFPASHHVLVRGACDGASTLRGRMESMVESWLRGYPDKRGSVATVCCPQVLGVGTRDGLRSGLWHPALQVSEGNVFARAVTALLSTSGPSEVVEGIFNYEFGRPAAPVVTIDKLWQEISATRFQSDRVLVTQHLPWFSDDEVLQLLSHKMNLGGVPTERPTPFWSGAPHPVGRFTRTASEKLTAQQAADAVLRAAKIVVDDSRPFLS
jgi:hypothetical protein